MYKHTFQVTSIRYELMITYPFHRLRRMKSNELNGLIYNNENMKDLSAKSI